MNGPPPESYSRNFGNKIAGKDDRNMTAELCFTNTFNEDVVRGQARVKKISRMEKRE
jgi:hypothetical protein